MRPVRSFFLGALFLGVLFAGGTQARAQVPQFGGLDEPGRTVVILTGQAMKGKKVSSSYTILVYTRPELIRDANGDPDLDSNDNVQLQRDDDGNVVLESDFPENVPCDDPTGFCSKWEIFAEVVEGNVDKFFWGMGSGRTIWESSPNMIFEDPPGSGSLFTIANQDVSVRIIFIGTANTPEFTATWENSLGHIMLRGYFLTDVGETGAVTVHAISPDGPKDRELIQGAVGKFVGWEGSSVKVACTRIPIVLKGRGPNDPRGQNDPLLKSNHYYANYIFQEDGCSLDLDVNNVNGAPEWVPELGSTWHVVPAGFSPTEPGDFCNEFTFDDYLGNRKKLPAGGKFSISGKRRGCAGGSLGFRSSPLQLWLPTGLNFLIPYCIDAENPGFPGADECGHPNAPGGNVGNCDGSTNYCDSLGLTQ